MSIVEYKGDRVGSILAGLGSCTLDNGDGYVGQWKDSFVGAQHRHAQRAAAE